MTHDRLRLGFIGAGWISSLHLAALDRLDRTTLVGVASARLESAEATAEPRGAAAYDDAERMLDEQRPDVVFLAVPPSAAIAACEAVVARGIPFLAEKPLAATDAGVRRASQPRSPSAGSSWPWATTCARSSGSRRSAPGSPPTPRGS